MVEVSVIDSVSAKPMHLFRGSFIVEEKDRARPFGGPGMVDDHFVERLLGRAPGYDGRLAYVSSVIAGWSYADGRALARQLKYYGLAGASVEEISMRNPAMFIIATAYFIRSKCGRLGILSFRGTEPTSIVNWLTDADVDMQRFSDEGGAVHRGFYANVRSLWEDIHDYLHDAIDAVNGNGNGGNGNGGNGNGGNGNGNGGATRRAPLEQLFITGHSLGAAMAVIAAAKICEERPLARCFRGIYTFGQPAVGDDRFAKYHAPCFGDRLYRHEFHFDAVPRLPPSSTGKYAHFGNVRTSGAVSQGWEPLERLSPQSRFLIWTAFSVFGSFIGRRIPALAWLDSKVFRYSIFDDHSPTRYIETCRATIAND